MIYLDHNATTPVLPEVREAMLPHLGEEWGNPSSTYRFGSHLKAKIEGAREQVAALIGCKMPREIIFTSGGTESNNTAIHAATVSQPDKKHIITSQVEHSSVLTYCRFLEKHHGYRVTYLPVDREGLLSMADLENSLSDDTAVVSLMWANNETGVFFPVEEIAQICRSRGVLYHCDAVQAVGKLPVKVRNLPVDYVSITGHKFGAPKGIGALYVQMNAPFVPLVHGGHQEHSRRGGTENVAGITALGVAAAVAMKKLADYDASIRPLRDALEEGILSSIPDAERNGNARQRLANTANVFLPGIDSDAVLTFLDSQDICASSGSACMESAITPSHVIKAMSGSHDRSSESIRFSLSSTNTFEEVKTVVMKISQLGDLVS
ncbi:MAG: aminotransferase class V-fold PLP-dependent enzyme [Verrucomicrobiales bacterium]|nr:aminotransferase class V-fold PLP-dependent enzyme [Verrucomicrobiales bacterium]MCP5559930.1 aminotransferase class V-fold PLP-dependent enzyme [Verrucomicrobiaceae bacterium]